MRITIAGAAITDAVVDVLDTLQNQPETVDHYAEVIDQLKNYLITSADEVDDRRWRDWMCTMSAMFRDLLTLSSPPDIDDPENDTPAFEA